MKISTFLLIQFVLSSILPVIAEDSCDTTINKEKIATAGKWDNLRNNKGSLKFETSEILKCNLPNLKKGSTLLITSVPKVFLKNYDDESYCKSKLAETKNSPYKYDAGSFSGIDELNDWIKDFSQGSGKAGKDLYEKCDKSCSPQYTYKVSKNEADKLTLSAEAVCGEARDKDDNAYVLNALIK